MTRDLFVFLLNAAWQAAVFFLVGAIAARALRRASAGAQYVLAVTGLIAASLTPWLSMIPLPNSESLVHRWAWQSRPATVFGLLDERGFGRPSAESCCGARLAHRSAGYRFDLWTFYRDSILQIDARLVASAACGRLVRCV